MGQQGFAGVRRAAEDISQRRAGGGDGQPGKMVLKDRESTVVRFLEEGDEVHWCWTHKLPPKPGRNWGDPTPCRDQEGNGEVPCPMCEAGGETAKRSFKGFINVIRRDAPTFQRDKDGNIVKDGNGNWVPSGETTEQLQYWEGGITVFDELDTIDRTYKGLSSRDFLVTRKGERLNTKYSIVPADPDAGAQPMSDADVKLAEGKRDLKEKTTPLSYEDMQKAMQGGQTQAGNSDNSSGGEVNPFLARRNQG